eukprot:246079_1
MNKSLWSFKISILLLSVSIIGFIILLFTTDDTLQSAYNITSYAILPNNNHINHDYITHDYKQYIAQHPDISNTFHKIGNDNIIHYNPILKDQCKNALIYKENIDIHTLLNQT